MFAGSGDLSFTEMTATSTTRKPSLQPQAPTTRSSLELPAVEMPQLTATSGFTLQPQSPIPSRDTLNNSQRRRGLNLGDYSIPCCHHFNASPATNHMGLETPCDQYYLYHLYHHRTASPEVDAFKKVVFSQTPTSPPRGRTLNLRVGLEIPANVRVEHRNYRTSSIVYPSKRPVYGMMTRNR